MDTRVQVTVTLSFTPQETTGSAAGCACKIRDRKHVDALIETLHVLLNLDDKISQLRQRHDRLYTL